MGPHFASGRAAIKLLPPPAARPSIALQRTQEPPAHTAAMGTSRLRADIVLHRLRDRPRRSHLRRELPAHGCVAFTASALSNRLSILIPTLPDPLWSNATLTTMR